MDKQQGEGVDGIPSARAEPYIAGVERIARAIPAGMMFQYRVVMRGDYPQPEHIWMLVGETGAIHVSARWSSFGGHSEWLGGIECHYASPPDYYEGTDPHHAKCWVLQKPCWHDGTSLGFSEQIAPYLSNHTNAFREDDHAMVLSVMRHWHSAHFPASAIEAAAAGPAEDESAVGNADAPTLPRETPNDE